MAADAKARVDTFWKSQDAATRNKARWKKNLMLDAYMSAFGRGALVAELDDVEIAVRTRQLVIRQTMFTTEVPDRVGSYLGQLKTITEKMAKQLAVGADPNLVAKTRRDFERESHAHRDNEMHIFDKV